MCVFNVTKKWNSRYVKMGVPEVEVLLVWHVDRVVNRVAEYSEVPRLGVLENQFYT